MSIGAFEDIATKNFNLFSGLVKSIQNKPLVATAHSSVSCVPRPPFAVATAKSFKKTINPASPECPLRE